MLFAPAKRIFLRSVRLFAGAKNKNLMKVYIFAGAKMFAERYKPKREVSIYFADFSL
jgi:hypothetical protein